MFRAFTSAPYFTHSCTTSKCSSSMHVLKLLYPDALCNGVRPWFPSTLTCAPWSRSIATNLSSRWPDAHEAHTKSTAKCKGVSWSLSRAFTSAPRSTNSFATLKQSALELYKLSNARCNGVQPLKASTLTLAPWSRSIPTNLSSKKEDTTCNGFSSTHFLHSCSHHILLMVVQR